jgi:hypothetical protein
MDLIGINEIDNSYLISDIVTEITNKNNIFKSISFDNEYDTVVSNYILRDSKNIILNTRQIKLLSHGHEYIYDNYDIEIETCTFDILHVNIDDNKDFIDLRMFKTKKLYLHIDLNTDCEIKLPFIVEDVIVNGYSSNLIKFCNNCQKTKLNIHNFYCKKKIELSGNHFIQIIYNDIYKLQNIETTINDKIIRFLYPSHQILSKPLEISFISNDGIVKNQQFNDKYLIIKSCHKQIDMTCENCIIVFEDEHDFSNLTITPINSIINYYNYSNKPTIKNEKNTIINDYVVNQLP